MQIRLLLCYVLVKLHHGADCKLNIVSSRSGCTLNSVEDKTFKSTQLLTAIKLQVTLQCQYKFIIFDHNNGFIIFKGLFRLRSSNLVLAKLLYS